MSENKNSKEENWSGESSLFEEWNFVVRKTTSGADDAGSDGDSVEILTREKAESVTEIDDEDYCESCDKDSIENKSRKNSVSEENHPENEEGDRSLVNDGSNSNDANSNIVIEEPSDEAENKSSSSEETSVVPVKNETLVERTPVSDEDTPSIENGRLYFTASVVLFIGWIILAFYASTDDSIEKSNLNDDIKWQVMNERYSKLVQELALYKEKSKLIDLSLNDLKTQNMDRHSSEQDEKWKEMYEKYLKLEKDFASFKEESSLEEPKDLKTKFPVPEKSAKDSVVGFQSKCRSGKYNELKQCDESELKPKYQGPKKSVHKVEPALDSDSSGSSDEEESMEERYSRHRVDDFYKKEQVTTHHHSKFKVSSEPDKGFFIHEYDSGYESDDETIQSTSESVASDKASDEVVKAMNEVLAKIDAVLGSGKHDEDSEISEVDLEALYNNFFEILDKSKKVMFQLENDDSSGTTSHLWNGLYKLQKKLANGFVEFKNKVSQVSGKFQDLLPNEKSRNRQGRKRENSNNQESSDDAKKSKNFKDNGHEDSVFKKFNSKVKDYMKSFKEKASVFGKKIKEHAFKIKKKYDERFSSAPSSEEGGKKLVSEKNFLKMFCNHIFKILSDIKNKILLRLKHLAKVVQGPTKWFHKEKKTAEDDSYFSKVAEGARSWFHKDDEEEVKPSSEEFSFSNLLEESTNWFNSNNKKEETPSSGSSFVPDLLKDASKWLHNEENPSNNDDKSAWIFQKSDYWNSKRNDHSDDTEDSKSSWFFKKSEYWNSKRKDHSDDSEDSKSSWVFKRSEHRNSKRTDIPEDSKKPHHKFEKPRKSWISKAYQAVKVF